MEEIECVTSTLCSFLAVKIALLRRGPGRKYLMYIYIHIYTYTYIHIIRYLLNISIISYDFDYIASRTILPTSAGEKQTHVNVERKAHEYRLTLYAM